MYHNTGPPRATLEIPFATDIEFQEHVQSILQSTFFDAHTRYRKPACSDAIFVQPIAFDLLIVEATEPTANAKNEPFLYLMRNIYTDTYVTIYPYSNIENVIGKQVLLLNGLEFTSVISTLPKGRGRCCVTLSIIIGMF